ncbi:uncharacterized protein LOC129230145 [Uloborus diversus]|uniref:uncharacterized protein LOC129230145 n=1 Tax=Uloborus diversus TaxID=327109 RepID=UPI002409074C|nr:uncharacterized protein LOC129230145 [Uloborus diversus]
MSFNSPNGINTLTYSLRTLFAQVCRNWNRIFYSKRVWETFILHDRTLTRRKFNYYMGDQYVLDHYRMQLCLHKVSRGFRKIIIKPMENFFNLYEFMMILSYYCEKFEQLHLIRTLDFTFGCEFAAEKSQNSGVDDKVFGTGGKLLEALKRLMNDLPGLKHIYLQDLLLEKEEAISLLDDVAYNCCETLKSLRIINCCKDKYAMLHPAVFINLQTLTLSTQHLSEDLLLLLGDIRLENLYLVQTCLTPAVSPIPTKVWRECHKSSPFLRVHHLLEGPQKSPVVWQEGAAVRSVVFDCPENETSIPSIFTATNLYSNTLEVLAFLGLPQHSLQDNFEDRADTALMWSSRHCLYLDTLVVRDIISTGTVLLIAHQAKNLRRLIVRKRALLRKCEWPYNPEWSDFFYQWLRKNFDSYERTAEEVTKLLGHKWTALTDEEFQKFKL